MRIEEVEALESSMRVSDYQVVAETAIAALRAEAWHPIEKAERIHERELLGFRRTERIWEKMYWSDDKEAFIDLVTGCRTDYSHFRFINPPEN